MIITFITTVLLLFSGGGSLAASSSSAHRSPSLRHLPTASCSRLQHELQRSILEYDWIGLDRLRFQRRLRLHPRYIVTIENVVSAHDPLVELRCPGSSPGENKLEIHFHESRFSAKSVKLFDIRSIFPIHSGAMGGVRVRIPPMGVELTGGLDLGRSVLGVSFIESSSSSGGSGSGGGGQLGRINFVGGKEEEELIRHREDEDGSSVGGVDIDEVGVGVTSSLVGVEREIEGIFVGRVLPLVKAQLEAVVFNTTAAFFEDNLVLF